MPRHHKPLRGQAERNALAARHLPLVGHVLGRMFGSDRDGRLVRLGGYGEAVGLAHEALVRAADLWDPARGCRFSTYACRAIFSRVRRAVARAGVVRFRPAVSLDALRAEHGDNFAEPLAGAPEGEPPLEGGLGAALRHLHPRQLAAVRARFWEGLSRSQAAARLGVSCERVRQLEGAALARLRRVLGEGRHDG